MPFYGAFDLIDFVHPNKNYSDRLIGRLAMTLDPLTTNCTEAWNTATLPSSSSFPGLDAGQPRTPDEMAKSLRAALSATAR
ncbi:hypothetical protein [Variovorax sp. J22R115]|uniref:hypothetical protein n=1 Tax=Variovorax sp. J22R115 TaxID=3053509 RepID=UPI0025754F64|nr:hypothetical protein [Variovorax sp. J22R115]MDM0047452.1 hypothetical protein [Variovorax sp. J22R115]